MINRTTVSMGLRRDLLEFHRPRRSTMKNWSLLRLICCMNDIIVGPVKIGKSTQLSFRCVLHNSGEKTETILVPPLVSSEQNRPLIALSITLRVRIWAALNRSSALVVGLLHVSEVSNHGRDWYRLSLRKHPFVVVPLSIKFAQICPYTIICMYLRNELLSECKSNASQ